jgi:excisionase family DNA binding protein
MPNVEIPNPSRFLKVAELAELLKIKPRTIYEMVAQDRIPYRKPPGSNILRFDLDEILAWTKGSTNDNKMKN